MPRMPVSKGNHTRPDVAGLVAEAMKHHQAGDLARAKILYQTALLAQPDHPEALHFAGVLAHQQGRSADAAALIARSLALVPGQADWHSNHGMVLQDMQHIDMAIAAYERALALQPRHANALNNIGVLYKSAGKTAEAEAAYRAAIRSSPGRPDPYHNLATLLRGLGRTEEAIENYLLALERKPSTSGTRRHLALAYHTLGKRDAAIGICRAWLASAPDDPVAQHTLAAITGENIPRRASDAFVTKTFDDFATSFEAKLDALHYKAPALVAAALGEAGLKPAGALDVLDAGCGTGLCGPLIAPYARRLTGVDLSDGMLHHARAKKVYDALVKSELTSYLVEQRDAFDLIVSADTLVYFGALEAVFVTACGALRPLGHLVFTVEEAGAGDPEYSLRPHGRFSHQARYVEACLRAAGFDAGIARADLRMEAGLPVAGLVVTATRREAV